MAERKKEKEIKRPHWRTVVGVILGMLITITALTLFMFIVEPRIVAQFFGVAMLIGICVGGFWGSLKDEESYQKKRSVSMKAAPDTEKEKAGPIDLLQDMLLQLNMVAREYCGFNKDMVFEIQQNEKNAFFIEKTDAGYNVWSSGTNGEKICRNVGCTVNAAINAVQNLLFGASDLFLYSVGGREQSLVPGQNAVGNREYEVYEQLGGKGFAGQGDMGYSWKYLCKDTMTGKYLIITETMDWSVYAGGPEAILFQMKENALKDSSYCPYITLSYAPMTYYEMNENAKPIITTKLPITICLIRKGVAIL